MLTRTNKISTKPRTFSAEDSYKEFVKELIKNDSSLKGQRAFSITNGKILREDDSTYIDYPTYKKVLGLFAAKAAAKLIQGYTIDFLNGLGYLFICRIGRNPSKPKLNKGESYRLKKQLEANGTITKDNWKIYHTDDEYIRVKWFKPSFVKNGNFYTFAPAGGQPGKGFRQLMSRTIITNPTLKALYPYIPYLDKSKPIATS